MLELGWAGGRIVSPLLAAMLLTIVPLEVLSLIDFLSYAFAVTAVLALRLPKPETAAEAGTDEGPWLSQLALGWTYISRRPGLVGMLVFFVICNFSLAFVQTLFAPMILSFSSVQSLGVVSSIGSIGILAGGVLMMLWGGPKRRIHGVLGFGLLFGLAMLLIGAQPSIPFIAAATFLYYFSQPIINAAEQTIWQTKIPLDVQGRVLATRRAIEMSLGPIAYLTAGPLTDRLLEPLFAVGGPLEANIGQLIGVGPGRGMGFLLVLMGLVPILAVIWGYVSPRIRRVEDELPDAVVDDTAAEAGTVAHEGAGRPASALAPS
jgi:hypothetical protein